MLRVTEERSFNNFTIHYTSVDTLVNHVSASDYTELVHVSTSGTSARPPISEAAYVNNSMYV